MDIQFIPDVFLSHLINSLYGALMIAVMLFLQHIIFLEHNTPKQKKVTRIIIVVYIAISTIVAVLFGFFHENFVLKTVEIFASFLIFVVIAYSSITGRKKAKWLGLFTVVPMSGYYDLITKLFDIPIKAGAVPEKGKMMYQAIVCSVMLVAIVALYYKKPKFIRVLERDIETRSLIVWEELLLWAVGLWLFIYGLSFEFMFPDISNGTKVYLDISNFFTAFAIVLLVVDSNYRNYYYTTNMKLQKSLITTMADLVENRDENTGGHIQRTAKYVEIIAKRLQSENKFTNILTDKYIENMVVAAPLHDVGKIHIPDAVLNKPGRLDDNEFTMMKTHASAGGKIIDRVEESVGDIEYLRIAKEMAEYHHERMDGKGYPHGISGDEIPLCARILAVADVFDALASKRCYKEPMPLDKAFAIIKEETGPHFDVDVAQAFLDSRDEIEKIIKKESYGNANEQCG